MAVLIGKNTKIWWNGSPAEHLESIEPEIGYENPDNTDIGVAGSMTLPTIQNPKLSFTFKRDTAATVQNAILADMTTDPPTARAVRFYESATKYWLWNAYIESWKPSGIDAKGIQKVTVTINGTSDGTAATYN